MTSLSLAVRRGYRAHANARTPNQGAPIFRGRSHLSDAGSPPAHRLPLSTIIPFSAPSIPVSALGVSVVFYLAPYLASHLGVSLTVVGVGWFIVRGLDLGVDLGLGIVMNRTHTPLGRYRLWMMLGSPILMAGLYMLFMAPMHIGMVYLVGWLLVLYV